MSREDPEIGFVMGVMLKVFGAQSIVKPWPKILSPKTLKPKTKGPWAYTKIPWATTTTHPTPPITFKHDGGVPQKKIKE